MINDLLVSPRPIARISTIGIIAAAILLFAAMAASTVLGVGTRISQAFEPFAKSPNERVSESFEDIKGIGPISDELKSALASLSQSVQGAQKPPVQAQGH
ncbi:hypothetical protein AB8Z38_21065 [Bradyrhizobium sp. LLZ17]|uniref:Uncharacterized protein n=1 Tax=Bradyrhizobium sp. LLZ17 TaxID=3239388 RepID=A0AB39XE82_9BRAD